MSQSGTLTQKFDSLRPIHHPASFMICNFLSLFKKKINRTNPTKCTITNIKTPDKSKYDALTSKDNLIPYPSEAEKYSFFFQNI